MQHYADLQLCIKSALNFKTCAEWRKQELNIYYLAKDRKFLSYIYLLTNIKVQKQKKTFDECVDSSKKCKSIAEWRSKFPNYYDSALKKGWSETIYKTNGWELRKNPHRGKKIIVFGIQYTSILVAKRENGCNTSHGKDWDTYVNQANGDIGVAIEIRVISQAITENKLREKEIDQERRRSIINNSVYTRGAEYSRLVTCHVCNRLHGRKYKGPICSDKCLEKRRKKNREAFNEYRRKIRKEFGRAPADRGKIKKRHEKYGADYDTKVTASALAKRDGMRCQLCGCKVEPHLGRGYQPRGWTVGHIIPASMGGGQTFSNTQCECSKCNSSKGIAIRGQLSLDIGINAVRT